MNQLTGRYVNVVLTIEEGRGMEFIKNPIFISANFNGRVLESDTVEAAENPTFNTELVWEIEKKDLRKIRSSNQPLRMDCFSVGENRKERVGFALLSLRSAKIIGPTDYPQITWQKFIGVHDKKCCQPELSLSLTIQEHTKNAQSSSDETVTVMPYISEEESQTTELDSSSDHSDLTAATVKYLEDGYISVGEPSCNEEFSLAILVKISANLDLLLPEVLVFGSTNQKFFLCFKIFGVVIKTKPFDKTLTDTIVMNEKIVVRLLSNKDALRDFFKSQKVHIHFCCGNEKLGVTEIDLNKIILSEDDDEILECEEICYFKFPSPNGIVPTNGSLKPHIQVQTSLMNKGPKNEERAGGDRNDSVPLSDAEIGNIIDINEVQDEAIANESPTPKEENLNNTKSLSTAENSQLDYSSNSYKKYSLEGTFKNFSILQGHPDKTYDIRVLHPKAASYLPLIDPGNSSENKFRILYVSSDNQILNLVRLWPPKFRLTDKKQLCASEDYAINTSILLDQYKTFKEDAVLLSSYKTILKSRKGGSQVARVEVTMSLSALSLESQESKTNFDLFPVVIDEDVMIREMADLEKWKHDEKISFKQRMIEMEQLEWDRLRGEMMDKKMKTEEVINRQVEKCRQLQNELQLKVDSFKTEKMIKKKKKSFSAAVLDNIKEKVTKYSKCDIDVLMVVLNKLEADNQALKDVVAEQNEELRLYKKSALTKEQTTNLLQELRGLEEKFEEAQRAKGYFKLQWKKAYEEVHALKKDDYKQLQDQIRENKAALTHLSLDSYSEFDQHDCNTGRTNTSCYNVFNV